MNPPRRSLHRRLVSGGAWVVACQISIAIIGLLTNMLLARLMSPGEMGSYFLLVNLVTIASALALLGQGTVVVRLLSESIALAKPGRARQAVSLVLRVGFLSALAVGLLVGTVGRPLIDNIITSPRIELLVALAGFWVFVRSMQRLLGESFRGLHDLKLSSLFSGVVSGLGTLLLLCIIYVVWGKADLLSVVSIAIGSLTVSALLAGLLLQTRMRLFRGSGNLSAAVVLGLGLPMMVSQLTNVVLTRIDIWILGAFRSIDEVAVYGAALQLALVVAMPVDMARAVLSSTMSELYTKGDTQRLERVMRATATLITLPVLAALAILTFWGAPLLGLIFGDFYTEGAQVLPILCLPPLISASMGASTQLLLMSNQQRVLMLDMLAALFCTVALALSLADTYGMLGVAWATVAGSLVAYTLIFFQVRQRHGIRTYVTLDVKPILQIWPVLRSSRRSRRPKENR